VLLQIPVFVRVLLSDNTLSL